MVFVILACSVLLSWIIGLSLWQGIVIVLFVGSVWVTGRKYNRGIRESGRND